MSTYPGENPQPEQQPPADDGTEPTQPVGYRQHQAPGQPAGPPQPTTPYSQPHPGQPQPGTPANPYGAPQQPGYPAPPPQGPSGAQGPAPVPPAAYGPPPGGYGPPPGAYAASGYVPFRAPVPDHPQSTLSLVLGLVGLIGAFVFCGVPLVVSPFAWALGRNALKEIRASQGTLGGESQARTGMILGIIGTVLAALALLALVAFIVAIAAAEPTVTGSSV